MSATQNTPMNPMQTAIRRARRFAAISALAVAALAVPAASASATERVLQDPLVSSVAASPTPTTGAPSTLELSAQTDPHASLPKGRCDIASKQKIVVCHISWGGRVSIGVGRL